MIRLTDIKQPINCDTDDLIKKAALILGAQFNSFSISKRAIDARDKSNIHYVYSVDVETDNDEALLKSRNIKNAKIIEPFVYEVPKSKLDYRPVVVGTGPCGIFAALTLAKAGARPIVLERGQDVRARKRAVDSFWKTGKLKVNSNVQFGEGGAGTFSDGKLNTGIKSPLIKYILEQYVELGAPNEILYNFKPHIGTDNLEKIAENFRTKIEELGGEIRFNAKVTDIKINDGLKAVVIGKEQIETRAALFAIGHSARDTFEMLLKKGVAMEQKPFAVGVRIEHLQEMINKNQYGNFKGLEAADYKVVAHTAFGGCYSFCMCPGGEVVAAASEEGGLVTNGMSYFKRDGKNANSALLVGVNSADFGSDDVLAGMNFQRIIEKAAFIAGGENYHAPIQFVGDLLKGRASKSLWGIKASYTPGVTPSSIEEFLPQRVVNAIKEGIEEMDKRINGFKSPEAVMTGVESRSSSPVRILRGENFEASIKGLYPCGEGAGYAGGIISAAVDGINTAHKLLK